MVGDIYILCGSVLVFKQTATVYTSGAHILNNHIYQSILSILRCVIPVVLHQ